MRELPADLLTPVAAYLRLRERGPSFLLESIERGERVGRYSFLAAGCEVAALAAAEPDGGADGDPLAPLRSFLEPSADGGPSRLPAHARGAIGSTAPYPLNAARRYHFAGRRKATKGWFGNVRFRKKTAIMALFISANSAIVSKLAVGDSGG